MVILFVVLYRIYIVKEQYRRGVSVHWLQ